MENRLFNRLLQSAEEMVAIEKGELPLPEDRVQTFTIPDVKKIRLDNQLKQHELANVLGVSVALVQSWELNRRVPNGPALKLLLMLEQQPTLIETLKMFSA